jgi:hypothetical protein
MKTNEILHNPDKAGEDRNTEKLVYELARIVLRNANGTMVEKDSEAYEALLARQIDGITNMLRNDISHIRESDRAFSGFGA